jgi:hypothetical protein
MDTTIGALICEDDAQGAEQMTRRSGREGIWLRTPIEALAVAPVPISVWTAIAVVEAIALFGTVITMVCFAGSPSSLMVVQGFLALSLVALIVAFIVVIVLSGRPRYSRHHRG